MAFKMPTLFGAKPPSALSDDLDMPTTQVKMAAQNASGYDPFATVSIMEQLRSATQTMKLPRRLPVIGSMPVVKQFQVLGTLLAVVVFSRAKGLIGHRAPRDVGAADGVVAGRA